MEKTKEPKCNISNYFEVVNQIKQLDIFILCLDKFNVLKIANIN